MALTRNELELTRMAAAFPMLPLVEAWAQVNSGSRNLDGLARLAAMLMESFSQLPGAVTLREGAEVDAVRPDGTLSPIAHGRHLHLVVRPDAPVQMLFTGHMDTVFGIDHPFQSLNWRSSEILNGPGVADMKGGLAIMLAALSAIESRANSQFGYEVLINSDEEVGSPSSAPLIESAAQRKCAAFTYEPSALPDGTLAGARAGSGNFSIIVTGKSAHAGRNPDEGRNALVAAADLAVRLKSASGEGFSCNPARIDGGSPNNVVPDRAILRVNFRPRTKADELAARDLIDRLMSEVAERHDVSLHLHGGFGRPPKPMDGQTRQLFELVRACGADLGQPIGWKDTGGVCDGNNIAACGVAVVDTMGVRGGSIHSDEEFMIAPSLGERAALSALAISRIIDKGMI